MAAKNQDTLNNFNLERMVGCFVKNGKARYTLLYQNPHNMRQRCFGITLLSGLVGTVFPTPYSKSFMYTFHLFCIKRLIR